MARTGFWGVASQIQFNCGKTEVERRHARRKHRAATPELGQGSEGLLYISQERLVSCGCRRVSSRFTHQPGFDSENLKLCTSSNAFWGSALT
jgi:hypothetical protein